MEVSVWAWLVTKKNEAARQIQAFMMVRLVFTKEFFCNVRYGKFYKGSSAKRLNRKANEANYKLTVQNIAHAYDNKNRLKD